MQHDLVNGLRRIDRIPFAPIIANGIRKDCAISIERGRADGTPYFGISFQSVFCVCIPEVESAITAGGAGGAVDRMEGDCVHGKYVGGIATALGVLTVAPE